MPTHVILGATGGVGSAILLDLLTAQTPSLQINLLVRSEPKLLAQMPSLKNPTSNIKIAIFEGSISDISTLTKCLQDATIIYQCISGSGPSKHTTIARNAAKAVVDALEDIKSKAGQKFQRLTVLLNRSSALNPNIQIPISDTFYRFLKWSLQDIYEDITAAAELYKSSASNHLLDYIFVDAPNLFHPFERVKTGHEVFTEGDITIAVNYADFGAGAVEIAGRSEEFRGKAVGVRAAGEMKPAWGSNLYALACGTWARLSPW